MTRTCVVLQPSYLPWRGYFHQIAQADVFVFYDDVQYDARGWRNRNRIKGPHGPQWLTVPVLHKGHQARGTPIDAVRIVPGSPWPRKHWRAIEQAYRRAPHFAAHRDLVAGLFADPPALLADLTIATTVALARALGLGRTEFLRSSQLGVAGGRSERLAAIARAVGAERYLSGPSAADYLDLAPFDAAGVAVEFMSYDYPPYEQLHPPYDPQVSIVDPLFTLGAAGTAAATWPDA